MKRSDVEDKVLLFGEGFETKLTDPDLKRQKILRTKKNNDNDSDKTEKVKQGFRSSCVFKKPTSFHRLWIVFIICTVLGNDKNYCVS